MAGKKFDLERMVEDWGMDYFARKATRKERKLLAEDCILSTVDWKKVTFDHKPTEYNPEPPAVGTGRPTDTLLFNTSFTNKTSVKQKYTFRVDRTTRSTCKLEVEQGFTMGIEMNVKLSTPCQIIEASAGFKEELTLKTVEGQTIEEEIAWGTNSEIEVDARSTAEVKLIVQEEEYDGRFQTRSEVGGRVRVVFTNVRDNNSFIKAVEGDIVDVARHVQSSGKISPKECGVIIEGRNIVCTTAGKCRFRYGVKQIVEVDQQPY